MSSTNGRQRRRVSADDVTLALRLHARDRDAFDQLFRRHARTVTRYVAARVGNRDRDTVDDLVQDAFCDALADPTRIDADVLGSLLRLAARACTRHDWSRRRYVRAAYTIYQDTTYQDTTGWQAAGPPAPTSTPPVAGQPRVRHALARLSADERLAVQLIYLDGHLHETVAALMARSVPAVKALQRQALRHLHADLATADDHRKAVQVGTGGGRDG